MSNVEHPIHYNREDAMECIDEMELIFGREAVMNFCLCNAWKYRYRAADKNGEEDLAKSDWYIKKYKELKEAETPTLSTVKLQDDFWDGGLTHPYTVVPYRTAATTTNVEYINGVKNN